MKQKEGQIKNFLLKNKIASIVLGVAILAIGYVGFKALQPAEEITSQNFAEAAVTRGEIEISISGTGTTTPLVSKAVSSAVSGKVEKIHVQNGDEVTEDDVLYELSSDSLNLQLEKAKLEVEKAQLALDETNSQLKADTITAPASGKILKLQVAVGDEVSKNSTLAALQEDSQEAAETPVNSNSGQPINESQIKATLSGKVTNVYVQEGQVIEKGQKLFSLSNTNASTQQKSQQLTYKQAKVDLEDLKNQLAKLKVKAPADGVMSGMDVNEGDEISGGNISGSASNSSQAQNMSQGSATLATSTSGATTSLGKIINTEEMKVSFQVDEVDITKVKVGQVAEVTFDALPDETFKGTVEEIAEEGISNNNVSSFEVIVVLDNSKKLVKSGMTANVTIIVAKKENALLIPVEALMERGEEKTVLTPAGRNLDQQSVQAVSVGLVNETFAEITEGLQEGDIVLLAVTQTQNQNANNRSGMIPSFSGGAMGGGGMPGGGRRVNFGSGR